MDYGIKGKVALVGGASKGIGRSCAASLAAEGARVAIVSRDAKVLEETAAELAAESKSEVIAVAADLATAGGIETAINQTRASLGEIDILVTNTGGPRAGFFSDLSDEDWDAGYHLLLKSAIGLIRAVLPGMQERGWGRIIGVTSVSVKEPIGNLLLSNVFRAGVTAMFKTLATQAASKGVTLNTVLPGLTDTDRLRGLYGAQAEKRGISLEAMIEKVGSAMPLGRLTRPGELGDVVAFLASEQASAITGSAVPIEGGQLRGLF